MYRKQKQTDIHYVLLSQCLWENKRGILFRLVVILKGGGDCDALHVSTLHMAIC